jgi:carbamoyl-phosphate synthase large subunit
MGSYVSQGIVSCLRQIKDIPIRIIGACIARSSVGLYLCDEALISPLAADEAFISWYIEVCNDKNIAITFTGVEENIDALVKNREKIEKACETVFLYPPPYVWDVGFDKFRTCLWLKENGFPYPEFALASDDRGISELVIKVGFPLIAKPRKGKSSSGLVVASSLKELMGIIGRDDYIVQECIGNADNEYTVGCYFSKDCVLQSTIILHRYLKNGGTSMAEIVNDERILTQIDNLSKKLHTSGPLNIQMRTRNDGSLVCFEWNVRYSGTTSIRNHFGFCDVEAAIREYVLHEDPAKCFHVADKGAVIRPEKDIYFDGTSFKDLFAEMKL